MYLNHVSKEYYRQDFEKVLSFKKTGSIWPLDTDLPEVLKLINSNSEIQTLYSKKYSPDPDTISLCVESYLQIAYTKNIEHRLTTFLMSVKNEFEKINAIVSIEKCEPGDNANYNPDSGIDLGCIKNFDYFRLMHFKIQLHSQDAQIHNAFYETLKGISTL